MEQLKGNQEYYTLKIIGNSLSPIGSGLISEELKSLGFNISEATVGRILRDLDIKGYTEKVGFRGRILTEKGKEKLKTIEQENEIKQYGNEFINLLKVSRKDELLDILVARRAIERELARLAAINAKEADIEALEKIVQSHERHFENFITGAKDDVDFHKLIAKMAKNRILDAAMDLIRQHGQLSPVLGYIRKEVKSTVVSDHKKILEAIAKRDPDKAERAMVRHIENLIQDVNRYWEIAESHSDKNV